MEYRNELLDGWVGKPVIVNVLKGPPLEDQHINEMVENPMFARSELLQSRRASFELVGYDRLGVTLRLLGQGEPPFFVPWGAVIQIEEGFEEHEELTH